MKRIAVYLCIHIPILLEEEFKTLVSGSVSKSNRLTLRKTLKYQENASSTVIFSTLQNGKTGKRQKLYLVDHLKLVGGRNKYQ